MFGGSTDDSARMPGILIAYKPYILGAVTLAMAVFFFILWRKKNFLSFFEGGKWWLTWIAIAIITLMDELTSIFYAPGEAFRFIGQHAIFFIAFTSLLMRLLSNRMTEIAQILEHHNIKGGGVYSFSYFVLGPTVSFVAVASIMVDYVLTASISTVSAVQNGLAFVDLSHATAMILNFGIIWFVATLNILGIRENARFTFGIFTIAAFVLVLLVVSGVIHMGPGQFAKIGESVTSVGDRFATLDLGRLTMDVGFVIIGVSSCILAYSGIESVVQTAGLVKSWHEIRKAYLFLALTVGIFTPVISALALSAPISPSGHETDLITAYAGLLNGPVFGITVGLLASLTLTMAVNTAFVASSELLERVADRYGFRWLIKTNARQSYYRIHIINGLIFSAIIVITRGSQGVLAEMYAIGLVASFVINMGSLLVYRYVRGTTEIQQYFTHRSVTLFLFIVLAAALGYLAYEKPYGLILWSITTGVFLAAGLTIARRRAPERQELRQTDSPFELALWLAASEEKQVHLIFRRPREEASLREQAGTRAYVSFYSPRQGIPPKQAENHFRFPFYLQNVFKSICTIIDMIRYELPDKELIVHLGWPMSSWMDRFSIGVLVMNLMRLPREYPDITFRIEYDGKR